MRDSINDAIWDWLIAQLDLRCTYDKSMALAAELLEGRA